MESLGLNQFSGVYRGRPVLITGHTGFKGSWLALWLSELGARVTGVALAPESSPNHWGLLDLAIRDHRQDINDFRAFCEIVSDTSPQIVFHLAAQPLVRRSYRDPLNTWTTNIIGTANVLEACRQTPGVLAVVVVTTDKCYENREWPWGYRENDRLGGHDPYSASKAAVELLAASYRNAFFNARGAPLVATVRAGNVIGGGDWSEDRLIPDLARAIAVNAPLEIRSPNATRPWQHVLDPLAGYLLLGQRLLEGRREYADAWNFGPDSDGNCTVQQVLDGLREHWPKATWCTSNAKQPHETTLLRIDSTKARCRLGWKPVWNLSVAVSITAHWYRAYFDQARTLSREQLADYFQAARAARVGWCGA